MWAKVPRRRRFWKYVSPRRHTVGLVILAILLSTVYGLWYFTNDRRIRRMAEGYFQQATGWQVQVGQAHFGFFSGVKLERVRVQVPDDAGKGPILEAREIVLRFHLGDLLEGKFQPYEVLCDGLSLTVFEKAGAVVGTEKMLSNRKKGPDPALAALFEHLPTVQIRNGLFRQIQIDERGQQSIVDKPLNLTMTPTASSVYNVKFENIRAGQPASVAGWIDVDLATGVVSNKFGYAPTDEVIDLLPPKYREFLKRYSVRGQRLTLQQTAANVHELDMEDLSLKLPLEDGGLELANVRGKLVFDGKSVTLKGVKMRDGTEAMGFTGKLPQLGNAVVKEISGRYDGLAITSPFKLHLELQDAAVPDEGDVTGPLGDGLHFAREMYNLSGQFSMSVDASRQEEGGKVHVSGEIRPQGMEAMFKYFAYPVKDVRGKVTFHDQSINIDGLTARNGPTWLKLTGTFDAAENRYKIVTEARDLAFNSELRQSLPQRIGGMWDVVKPSGIGGGTLTVTSVSGQEHDHIECALKFEGQGAAVYQGFPYPVEGISGQVRIDGSDVYLDNLQGRRGKMSCTIQGSILAADSAKPTVDVTVTAKDLPLDEALRTAMPSGGKAMLQETRASGQAQAVTATIKQSGGSPVEYNIQAKVKDASYRPEAFPYEVTGAEGKITYVSDCIVIDNLAGKHGVSGVTLSGTITPAGGKYGLDLRIKAADLLFDETLRSVLPEEAQRAWALLEPAGAGDVGLAYRRNLPGMGPDVDFDMDLLAKDMQIHYHDLPYKFTGVTGQAHVRPGWVEMKNVQGACDQMHVKLSGTVALGVQGDGADLKLVATDVKIDNQLLTGLPDSATSMLAGLKPGGQCNLDLASLKLVLPATPATMPATTVVSAATAPATPARSTSRPAMDPWFDSRLAASQPATGESPARPAQSWSLRGTIAFKDAVVDVGFGDKTLTGTLKGTAEVDAGQFSLQADADIDSIEVGGPKLTKLTAKIRKAPRGSSVLINDIAGQLMGGRLAGSAEIKLGPPVECLLQLGVHDVKIQEMLAGKDGAKAEGLLDGTLRLVAKVGQANSQQAVGELYISKAKLSRMPVLLGPQNALSLFVPGQGGYTDGAVRYELKGTNLLLNEMYLTSSGFSIVGSGQVDLNTQALRCTFLGQPGSKLPRIASLSDLLDRLVREISEIRVTGTLSKPVTRNVPLSSLDDAIRRLQNPAKED